MRADDPDTYAAVRMDRATDDAPTDDRIDWATAPPSLLTFTDYGGAEPELRPWSWQPTVENPLDVFLA